MKNAVSYFLVLSIFIQTNAFAQKKEPGYSVALKTLEQTEKDVATAIIKTTSVLHRLEKALNAEQFYKWAAEVPSSAYITAGGVTLGGVLFLAVGSTANGIASSGESSAESLTGIEHAMPSVEKGFHSSGNASAKSGEPLEASAELSITYGKAWLNATKWVFVTNPSSQKSGNFLLHWLVRPVRWVVVETAKKAWEGIDLSFRSSTTAYKALFNKVLSFGVDTATSSGESSAGLTILAAAGYSSYVGWTRGGALYDKTINLTDEQITRAVMFNPEIDNALEVVATNLTKLFSLTPNQKSLLKQTLADDLVTQKLLEYRAEDEEEVGEFNVLTSLSKVLDEYQLAALSALKTAVETEEFQKAIIDVAEVNDKTEAVAQIDEQIRVLELLRFYISQINGYEAAFSQEAIDEAKDLIKELDAKIARRKAQLEMLKK